jgi:hypothetical protein
MNAEYQRLEDEARDVDRQIREIAETRIVTSAVEQIQLERELSELHTKLRSLRHGMLLIRSVNSRKLREGERRFVKALAQRFHSQGVRNKTVELPGGVSVTLHLSYYHRSKCPEKAARKSRRGLYPALMLLGISDGFTPAVRSRMATAAALLGSFEEAAEMLAGDGIRVSVNRLRTVTAGMGRMLSRLTNQGALRVAEHAAGRRIVVTTDGGRVRLRERRRGKTKKGRKRFAAKWREPRLFMIYAVDDEGRLADDFPPIIDGTLGSCDELFAMMLAYLQGLDVTSAERVLFVADGASWIWRRVPGLLKSLGLTDEKVQQLIDFWHAVEYLGKIADSKSLSGATKKRWLTTQKKRLLRGEIGSVVDELRSLLGPRRTKDQRTWLNYFVKHGLTHRRMDYSLSRTHHMPIGSGAIESAIRRVINLRVKSNAVYWLRENAETIIRLRAWIKAGRAEELFQQTTCVTPQLAL